MAKKLENRPESAEQADFEAALGELEKIVEILESGELSLADSLERFKRGVGLSKRCHQLIDEARQSVEVLSDPNDEDSAAPDTNPGS
jgi:exodeoxyribonuclease VII small subunit